MFERMDAPARAAVMGAMTFARAMRCPAVEPGHLMLGIALGDGPAGRALLHAARPPGVGLLAAFVELVARVESVPYAVSGEGLPPRSGLDVGTGSFSEGSTRALEIAATHESAAVSLRIGPALLLHGVREALEESGRPDHAVLPPRLTAAEVEAALADEANTGRVDLAAFARSRVPGVEDEPSAGELIELIGLMDRAGWEGSGFEYVQVTRWTERGGETDERATVILRSLAREKLAAIPAHDVGVATLGMIDKEGVGP